MKKPKHKKRSQRVIPGAPLFTGGVRNEHGIGAGQSLSDEPDNDGPPGSPGEVAEEGSNV